MRIDATVIVIMVGWASASAKARGSIPVLATTSTPRNPDACFSRSIQPSKPRPLTTSTRAVDTALASLGPGS